MNDATHFSADELQQGVDHILATPKDDGELKLIVRRPEVDERETPSEARLDVDQGLVGDNWLARGSRHMPDGAADPDMQLNIMNSRVVDLVAGSEDRWALAGDQLFVDMDLSRTATYWLQEVRGALRCRRHGVRELGTRQGPQISRHLRQGR
jgi:hypothetical protein